MKTIIKFIFLVVFFLFPSISYAKTQPLQICTHLGFAPYIIHENKKLQGIDIDIVLHILRELKQDAEINPYPWKRLLELAKVGKCDIAFALFDTSDRRSDYDYLFSVPIHYSTFSVFVPKQKTFRFQTVSDFFGKTVAHNRGFSLSIGLEQAIRDQKIKRVLYDDLNTAIHLLENNRIDAIIENDARFRYHLKQKRMIHKYKALDLPFLPHQPAFIVFSKSSQYPNLKELKASFENILKKMHSLLCSRELL